MKIFRVFNLSTSFGILFIFFYGCSNSSDRGMDDSLSTDIVAGEADDKNKISIQHNHYTGVEYRHNLNLGDVCNATGDNKSGVIHQVSNKMISVSKYPDNINETGSAFCIRSNDREPEYLEVKFSCKSNGVINWVNSDVSGCASFAERNFSCSQFDKSNDTITQINLSTFKRNSDNMKFRFHRDISWFNKLDNQYQMLAFACNHKSVNSTCISDPNNPNCYGEFDKDSVNFPDQLFPTYLGPTIKSPPGYQGNKTAYLDNEDDWSYFLVAPRYGVSSFAMEASHTLAVRRDRVLKFDNYETISTNLTQFNPASSLNLVRNGLDYHQVHSFRNNAAINEFRFMSSIDQANVKKKYYFDHIPLVYFGHGEFPNIFSSGNQMSIDRNKEYFSRTCLYGCKKLVITSHESCDKINEIDSETNYVCLPKNLDIMIQQYEDHSNLFTIKGYDDVHIYGLNLRVYGSYVFSEAYNYYLEKKNEGTWSEDDAKKVINYIMPKTDFFFDRNQVPEDKDFSVLIDTVVDAPEIYPNFEPHDQHHSLIHSSPDIVNFPDVGVSRSQGITLHSLFKSSSLKNDLNSITTGFYSYIYEHMLTDNISQISWNISNQIKPLKHIINVSNSENLLISDISIKSTVQGSVIKAMAKHNIVHGINIEGTSLKDFEEYGFIYNEEYPSEKGYLKITLDNQDSLTTTDSDRKADFKEKYYILGHGISSTNDGDQIRLDRVSVDYPMSSLAENFSLAFNLCQNISEANPLHPFALCSASSNYDINGKFTPNAYFNPFYYQDEGIEMRTSNPSFYDNNTYYNNFHLQRNDAKYLQAKRENNSNPISVVVNADNVFASYNLLSCNPNSDLGKSATSGEDSFCGHGGYYLSDAVDVDYLIVTNSTFKNHSGNNAKVTLSSGAVSLGGNYEFISTVSINSLIFNNIFWNQQFDMYDLNFRKTNLRTAKNKSLYQLVERNLFAYGVQGKVTGLGAGEQILKFANNLFLSVPIGGYHGLFRSFYLHNSHLLKTELLADAQQTPLMYDYLKPYGVRHSIYNSAVFMSANTFPGGARIIYSSNYRPKQHGFDYNFNYNLYFGEIAKNWFTSWRGRSFSNISTPLIDFDYKSNGCKTSSLNGKLSGGCSYDVGTGFHTPRFSFLTAAEYNLSVSSLGLDIVDTEFRFFRGIESYLNTGALEEHIFTVDQNNPNSIDLFQIKVDFDQDEWGKIYPYDQNYIFNGLNISQPIIGHTPSLDLIQKSPPEDKQRINYLWKECYQNSDSLTNEHELSYFKNDISPDMALSYRCVTGDTGSYFYSNSNATIDDIISKFVDRNIIGENRNYFLSDPDELPSVNDVLVLFDIYQDSQKYNLKECTNLKSIYESNLAPALHFDSNILSSGMKLSVYRDFNGLYRKAFTSRGPFEIIGEKIRCK